MVLWALWQRTEGRFTPLKKGNEAMNEKSEQSEKESHCALSPWHLFIDHTSEVGQVAVQWGGSPSPIPVESCRSQSEGEFTSLPSLKPNFLPLFKVKTGKYT